MADPLILEAALKMAAAGWPVLPLAGAIEKEPPEARNGTLTCACWKHDTCISPAKHPRTVNGLFDATTNADVIRGWFRGYRALNLGLRTGEVCDVVDIDVGGLEEIHRFATPGWEGFDLLTNDQKALGTWDGPVVRTGRGYHFYLRPQNTNNRAHMLPNVDYRGTGGYVVVPPSMHVNGTRYEWLRKGRLTDLPDWLREIMWPPTCQHVLRGGRVCGKAGTHSHGEVVFTSLVDQRLEVPS